MCCRLEAEKKENCWMLPSNRSTKRNPQRSKARINRENEKELKVLKSARMSMNMMMLAGREKMKQKQQLVRRFSLLTLQNVRYCSLDETAFHRDESSAIRWAIKSNYPSRDHCAFSMSSIQLKMYSATLPQQKPWNEYRYMSSKFPKQQKKVQASLLPDGRDTALLRNYFRKSLSQLKVISFSSVTAEELAIPELLVMFGGGGAPTQKKVSVRGYPMRQVPQALGKSQQAEHFVFAHEQLTHALPLYLVFPWQYPSQYTKASPGTYTRSIKLPQTKEYSLLGKTAMVTPRTKLGRFPVPLTNLSSKSELSWSMIHLLSLYITERMFPHEIAGSTLMAAELRASNAVIPCMF